MPYGDGSGPGGLGPQTGRGMGYCSGFSHPGYPMGPGLGGGRGRAMGRGFGRRTGFGPNWNYGLPEPFDFTPKQEKDYLKNQISVMEKTIENLRNRLNEIDKKK